MITRLGVRGVRIPHADTHRRPASLTVLPGRFLIIFLSATLSSHVILGTGYHNPTIYEANMETEGENGKTGNVGFKTVDHHC